MLRTCSILTNTTENYQHMYIFVLAKEQIECTKSTDEELLFHIFDTSYQKRRNQRRQHIF